MHFFSLCTLSSLRVELKISKRDGSFRKSTNKLSALKVSLSIGLEVVDANILKAEKEGIKDYLLLPSKTKIDPNEHNG